MRRSLFSGSHSLIDLFKAIKYKIDFRKEHPEYFDPSGTLIFTGCQGDGKTISAVNYVGHLAEAYPKSKLVTNVAIDPSFLPEGYEVIPYHGLDDLKNIENGYAGVIYLIDEIHLEMNSLESKNISIDIMTEISQQRKQRKHIVGTSQIYGRMAKPLREQVRDVVECRCFFGVLQFNQFIDAFRSQEVNGKLHAWVKRRSLWIHTADLYGAYDTYAKMGRYKQEWQGRPIFPEVIYDG